MLQKYGVTIWAGFMWWALVNTSTEGREFLGSLSDY